MGVAIVVAINKPVSYDRTALASAPARCWRRARKVGSLWSQDRWILNTDCRCSAVFPRFLSL